jgi:prephenate dehydratase
MIMAKTHKTIAFQGAHGAYSDLACRHVFPEMTTIPCNTFDLAFRTLMEGKSDLAMIPVDNTIAGRVADVHHLMPKGNLFITGEHFQQINHMLLGVKGTKISDLKYVHSHVHAIPQCRKIIEKLKLTPIVHADTAGAAKEIAERNDKQHGAIASVLAAEIYGLDVLEREIEDESHNTTRFLILSREERRPVLNSAQDVMSSFLFEVRNIPAALYKALGGFATNGISMTKLESYVDANFQAARFYSDVEGHPDSPGLRNALDELKFFAKDFRFLGCYPAHPLRQVYRSKGS